MRVYANKLMESFGCVIREPNLPQICPRCQTANLQTSYDHIADATMFSCSKCRFHHDAIQFTALMQGTSTTEALNNFKTGGDLRQTLQVDYTDSQLHAYVCQYHGRSDIDDYVVKTRKALESTTGRSILQPLREFNSGRGVVSNDTGMVLTSGPPVELHKLCTPEYKRNHHILFRYTYNGHTTGISTRTVSDMNHVRYFNLGSDDTGVYQEYAVTPDTETVYIAADEIMAASLYTRAQDHSLIPLPVVSTRGLPLPSSMQQVKRIYIVSTSDHQLTLPVALTYFTRESLFDSGMTNPAISVINMVSKLCAISVQPFLSTHIQHHDPLPRWIAKQLASLYQSHGPGIVIDMLHTHKFSTAKRGELAEVLQSIKAPGGLITLVETVQTEMTDECRLPNGLRIVRNIHGFSGFGTDSRPTPLSNTLFKVDKCIMTRDDKVLYDMTVTCLQAKNKTIQVTVPSTAFQSARALTSSIQCAYMRRGENVPILFYGNARGYGQWESIRDAFRDTALVHNEVDTLGVDSDLQLQLSDCRIDVLSGSVSEQAPLPTYRPEIIECYRGLSVDTSNTGTEALLELWSSDDTAHAAIALGLSHIIGQILVGFLSQKSGIIYRPTHLMYADIGPDTWDGCIEQLSYITRGSIYVPPLSDRTPAAFRKDLADLHCLPYICNITSANSRGVRQLLDECAVSLLGVLNNEQGEWLAQTSGVWFVALEQMPARLPGRIPMDLCQRVRDELLAFIISFIGKWHKTQITRWVADVNPALQVHSVISDQLGAERTGVAATICKKYYTTYSYSSVRAFLYELRRMFYMGESPYPQQTLVTGTGAPTSGSTSGVHVSTTDDCVYVHKHLAKLINKENKRASFDAVALTDELNTDGYLVSNDPGVYWAIRRDVWEHYVEAKLQLVHNKEKEVSYASN